MHFCLEGRTEPCGGSRYLPGSLLPSNLVQGSAWIPQLVPQPGWPLDLLTTTMTVFLRHVCYNLLILNVDFLPPKSGQGALNSSLSQSREETRPRSLPQFPCYVAMDVWILVLSQKGRQSLLGAVCREAREQHCLSALPWEPL
jgi:hypothetical protein